MRSIVIGIGVQLLLRQTGEPSVTILSGEGVTQGYPLLMIFYGITLVPLAKELRVAHPGLIPPLYADDVAFRGLAQPSAQLLKLLMERGSDRGYFPEPAKSLFILNTPGHEEAPKKYFEAEGLSLNFVSWSRYLGAYFGTQEGLAAWVKPQVEAWAHGVRILGKIYQ